MLHIAVMSLLLEKDSICNHIQMIAIILTRKAAREPNPLWVPCYIMPCQLIQQCCKQSMKYNNYNQNKKGHQGKIKKSIYYAATYSNAIICYKSRNIVLHVDSDAAFLTIPEARFSYAVHFYQSYWPSLRPLKPTTKERVPST